MIRGSVLILKSHNIHSNMLYLELQGLDPNLTASQCGPVVVKCNYGNYIYSSTALKRNFEVLIIYLSISILCHFVLLLYYISEENIVLILKCKLRFYILNV